MSPVEAVREHVREHHAGMLVDLVFAVGWVTLASLLVELLAGPQWAAYLLMFAGVVAYYVFVASLRAARGSR